MRFWNKIIALISILVCIMLTFSACQSEHTKLDYSAILHQFAAENNYKITSEENKFFEYNAELQNESQSIMLQIRFYEDANDDFELQATASSEDKLDYKVAVRLANQLSKKEFPFARVTSLIESDDPYLNFKDFYPDYESYKEYKQDKIDFLDSFHMEYGIEYTVNDTEACLSLNGKAQYDR